MFTTLYQFAQLALARFLIGTLGSTHGITFNNVLALQKTPTELYWHSNRLGIKDYPTPALVGFTNVFYNCPPFDSNYVEVGC